MSDLRPSERVTEAIHEAIREAGGMYTGHAAFVEFIDSDGVRAWCSSTGDTQGFAATLGMLRFHTISVEMQATNDLTDGEERP